MPAFGARVLGRIPGIDASHFGAVFGKVVGAVAFGRFKTQVFGKPCLVVDFFNLVGLSVTRVRHDFALDAADKMIVFFAQHRFAVVAAAKAVVLELLDFHVPEVVGPKGNVFCIERPVRRKRKVFGAVCRTFAFVVKARQCGNVQPVRIRRVEEHLDVRRENLIAAEVAVFVDGVERLVARKREEVVERSDRGEFRTEFLEFGSFREVPALGANVVVDIGQRVFEAGVRRQVFLFPVGVREFAAAGGFVLQILRHPGLPANFNGVVFFPVARVCHFAHVELARHPCEAPELGDGDAKIVAPFFPGIDVFDLDDNLAHVFERFVEHDDIGVRFFVALPFGLGERDGLDEIPLGVLVNLDRFREAEVDERRGIAQVAVEQREHLDLLRAHREFQRNGLVLERGAPYLVERVHVLFHNHVFGPVGNLALI